MKLEIENQEFFNENIVDLIEIPRISCDKLSYHQFFKEFMMKNLPVIIQGIEIKTELSEEWFSEEKVKLDKMLENISSDHNVPVANCSKVYFDSHEKVQMSFQSFVDYWNDRTSSDENLLYLKDFHMKQEFPDLDFYRVPLYFASDWLNEFLTDNGKDDYRFVYIGPKDTWTPFHSDVFGSFSWSSNIFGRKNWLILQPGEEVKLKDQLGNLPFQISSELLEQKGVKFFEVEQNCGETLFVPSKWFHQVKNTEDAVSFNHNWFNGCNAHVIAENLLKHFEDVEREISDCKDMENYNEHCQLMLKSSFGLNFHDFAEILRHIAEKRIKAVEEENFVIFDEFSFGSNHLKFDLDRVKEIATNLTQSDAVKKYPEIIFALEGILNQIKKFNDS